MNSESLLTQWTERLEQTFPGYRFPENQARAIHPELARSVRFIVILILDILRERYGPDFVAHIIQDISTAPGAGNEHGTQDDVLPGDTAPEDISHLKTITATFRMVLSILGLAEAYHQSRRFEQSGLGLGRTLMSLQEQGVTAQELDEILKKMHIRLVATAHPTNIFRSIVLGARREVFALIRRLHEPVADEAAFARLVNALRERFLVKSATRFERWEKPEVLDEVRQVIGYFRNAIYHEAPEILTRLQAEYQQIYGATLQLSETIAFNFGSWVGGDMDGNPFVNADVYRRAIELQRNAALDLFADRLADAAPALSFALSSDLQAQELLESIEQDLRDMREVGLDTHRMEQFKNQEPFRLKLEIMRLKIEGARRRRFEQVPNKRADAFQYYLPDETLADLEILSRVLKQNGFHATVREYIQPLDVRLRMFGFHLASLDLREDSVHIGRAARLALRAAGHDVDPADAGENGSMDRQSYIQLLTAEILNPRRVDHRRLISTPPFSQSSDASRFFHSREDYDFVHRIYSMLEAARYAQMYAGQNCTTNLILTMTSCVEDVLHALLLLKCTGIFYQKLNGDWSCSLNIVPLFETVGDLQAAEDIMRTVLDNVAYQAQLKARDRQQLMMLGFSDSNKDGGYFASNWSIYQAQRRLLAVADEYRVSARFFYGRGGSIGRGGASSRHVADSLPPRAIRYGYDLTEQGEVLSRYYVTREVARMHLETILSAAIEKNALPDPEPSAQYLQAAELLSDASGAAYKALVHTNPHLVAYFEECTPREVELVKIGSRPVRRRAMRTIADLRAIPWVFRWFQSRQFIPGWFGLGAGLTRLIQERDLTFVRQMFMEWKFFRAILENSALALARSDMEMAALYRDLAREAEAAHMVYDHIHNEWQECCQRLGVDLNCTIEGFFQTGYPILLASQKLKQPWVDALGRLQVRLLRRYRTLAESESEGGAEALETAREAVVSSIEGIAMGLGATG
ncbi:MAG: phosphoenolpyruvate carboxylase [Leptospiraceae bacterium]|nr:phosphoenolpyruvate carboxylase [Leptospiraceae bacterium]